MPQYVCHKCGAKYYSASEFKEDEPCEVCGNESTNIVDSDDAEITGSFGDGHE